MRSSLGADARLHTHVGIDFVPSLGDWKTAWDFIHFEGFLGARMSLQFAWAGSDSALAAPLVLDLARLADFAARAREGGCMSHVASFFKDPLDGGTHDFHAQYSQLVEYAEAPRRVHACPCLRTGARLATWERPQDAADDVRKRIGEARQALEQFLNLGARSPAREQLLAFDRIGHRLSPAAPVEWDPDPGQSSRW